MILKISNLLSRFKHANQGVAAVEFALILPLMLLIYLGTLEASRAISYHNRIISITSALGDLVAQTENNITSTMLNDYFKAAQTIIAPYPATEVKQIITNVYVNPAGQTSIVWSRGFNGGSPRSAINLPANIIDVAKDNYVIISEASLAYQPMITYIFPGNLDFYQIFYHLPRAGSCIGLNGSCP